MASTAITTFTNILYFPTLELIQNTPPTLILPHPLSFPHKIVIYTVMLYYMYISYIPNCQRILQ